MRKVHRPHLLIIQILDWKVRQHTSIGKLTSDKINLFLGIFIMDVVLAPFWLPLLRFECDRERTRHLDSFTDWQMWCGLLIEKSKYVVVEVDRSTGEFDASIVVEFGHC